jgi:hypothetical protein
MDNDQEGDRRRKYFEEYSDRVDRHRERESQYVKSAYELAASAMRAITYLNGGGLVAIPAAVALFRADPQKAKYHLIAAGLLFVAGLVSVVLAQAFAFFVEARRAEAEQLLAQQQIILLAAVHYPGTGDLQAQRSTDAVNCEKRAGEKISRSDLWRRFAIVMFWIAVFCFDRWVLFRSAGNSLR